MMNQQKKIVYSQKPQRKIFIDYSPKIRAKNQDNNAPRRGLKQQASAHMRRRNLQTKFHRLESPPQAYQKSPTKKYIEQRHILNQQQIQNSAIYRMLEEEMQQLAKRQEEELKKLRQVKQTKKKELEGMSKDEYSVKLQIWQLRNEITDLKDSIEEEKRESERLNQELGILEEQQENGGNQANQQHPYSEHTEYSEVGQNASQQYRNDQNASQSSSS